MKAKYQIDRMQLDDMELEIALKTTVKEWREIIDALENVGSGPTWPMVEPIQRIIRQMDEDTGKSYVATQYAVLVDREAAE